MEKRIQIKRKYKEGVDMLAVKKIETTYTVAKKKDVMAILETLKMLSMLAK